MKKTSGVKPYQSGLILDNKARSLIAEAYRNLRANLRFADLENNMRTFLVTSTDPAEGKTTTIANLAVSMARDGQRTLVVDSDLRKPTLHKVFRVGNLAGMTNLLLDHFYLDPEKLAEIPLGDAFFLIRHHARTGILTSVVPQGLLDIFMLRGDPIHVRLRQSGEAGEDEPPPSRLRFTPRHDFLDEPIEADPHKAWQFLARKLPHITKTKHLEAQFDNYFRRTTEDNLQLLTSGPIPPNPSEILGSSAMRAFMEVAKRRFDRIMFDSPPSRILSDAQILGTLVDGIILVVRSGRVNREAVLATVNQLRRVGTPVLGVVINDFDVKAERYYYSRYYYSNYYYYNYGYGYGYGYGSSGQGGYGSYGGSGGGTGPPVAGEKADKET